MRFVFIMKEWFDKPHIKMGLLIFFITLLIFGIGYILGRDWTPTPIIIEQNNNQTTIL